MSAPVFQLRRSIDFLRRHVADAEGFIASAFSFSAVKPFFALVRSDQLCCVEGSLWASPHFFLGNEGAACQRQDVFQVCCNTHPSDL